jgi:hypothetical protein
MYSNWQDRPLIELSSLLGKGQPWFLWVCPEPMVKKGFITGPSSIKQ